MGWDGGMTPPESIGTAVLPTAPVWPSQCPVLTHSGESLNEEPTAHDDGQGRYPTETDTPPPHPLQHLSSTLFTYSPARVDTQLFSMAPPLSLIVSLLLFPFLLLPSVTAISRFSLDGSDWHVTNTNGSISIPATVPGVIHLDLLNAHLIDDPYYRFNEAAYRWIAYEPLWNFTRTFTVPSAVSNHSTIELCFDGIDTIATVILNGHVIARPPTCSGD